MNEQQVWLTPSWFQRYVNALKETLDVSEEQKVEMIEFLFDAGFWNRRKLTFSAAVSKFNACLNPQRSAEFFKTAEILALMKRFGRHMFFHAIAEDLGYRVERLPSDERRLRALERLAAALEQRNQLLEAARTDAADAAAALHQLEESGFRERIHPALRELGANFSIGDDAAGDDVAQPGVVTF